MKRNVKNYTQRAVSLLERIREYGISKKLLVRILNNSGITPIMSKKFKKHTLDRYLLDGTMIEEFEKAIEHIISFNFSNTDKTNLIASKAGGKRKMLRAIEDLEVAADIDSLKGMTNDDINNSKFVIQSIKEIIEIL